MLIHFIKISLERGKMKTYWGFSQKQAPYLKEFTKIVKVG
jgi:hypothetical protein